MDYARWMTAGRLAGADGEEGTRGQASPMRSAVNWGLLGLIIERPTYAYDLGQRFERRYGSVLSLSNIGHVYTALGTLGDRGLVEEIAGTRTGRQPKPHYRATQAGRSAYRGWLVELAHEESRKRRLLVLALGALSDDAEQMLEALGECERVWLQEGMGTAIASAPEGENSAAAIQRLISEQERGAVGAKLEWLAYAREMFGRMGAGRAR